MGKPLLFYKAGDTVGIDPGADSVLEIAVPVLKYLWNALLTTGLQIFIFIGPGLILASLMNFVASTVEREAHKIFGTKIFLYIFGWLGTAVHEIGHAIFCVLFGHKITKMKLFSINAESGTLGHVNHTYNSDSLYQQIGKFFIGVGPILFGTIVIYYLSGYLLGWHVFVSSQTSMIDFNSFTSFNSVIIFLENIYRSSLEILLNIFSFQNFSNWKYYLFLYLAFSVGSSITLSRPDIEGAFDGLLVMFIALLLLNIATIWISGIVTEIFINISRLYTSFYSVMIFVILLNILISVVFLVISKFLFATKNGIQSVMERRK